MEYRFRVEYKDGQIKKGRVTASSEAEARSRIEQMGLKILDLQGTGTSTGARWKAGRVAPYQFGRLLHFYHKLSSDPRYSLSKLFGSLAAIGLLWAVLSGVWHWHQQPGKAERRAPKSAVNITITGEVSMPGAQDFDDVRILLDFPDIPYQISKPWSELEHPSQGHFSMTVSFVARTRPRQCLVKASKPKYVMGAALIPKLRKRKSAEYSVKLVLVNEGYQGRPTPKTPPQPPSSRP